MPSEGQQQNLPSGARLAPPPAVALGSGTQTNCKKQTTSAGGAKVTMGMVSSRAPSPGHDIDETTFDYINRAFTATENDDDDDVDDSYEYVNKPSPTE